MTRFMPLIIYILVAVQITLYIVLALMIAWPNFKLTEYTYHTENKCIAHWVRQGIDRRDIRRTNGTCTIIY